MRRVILRILLILISAAPIVAEAAPHELSLIGVRERASARSPEVRQALRRVREAEATRVGAGIVLPVNPTLQIEARPGLNDGTQGEFGYAAIIDALFEVGGAPGARVREAERRAAVAEAEALLSRLDSKLAVTEAYVAVKLARTQLAYVKEARAIAERLVAIAEQRSTAGAGSDVEVTTAKAELAERSSEVRAATSNEALAQMTLRLLADLAIDEPLDLVSTIDEVHAIPEAEALASRARAERPDLKLVDAKLALLKQKDERLRRELFPKLGGYLGVDAAPSSPWFGQVGLRFELPIAQRNQTARAVNLEESNSQLEVAQILLKKIDLELVHRRLAHEEARAQLEELGRDGIPVAERRLQLVEEGWKAGRFDVFRVTSAADDLLRLKALRIDVLQRIWRERLTLERLIGGFADEEI